MPDIAPLLARAARRLPLYAFSNTNRPRGAFLAGVSPACSSLSKNCFLSSTIGLRKPDARPMIMWCRRSACRQSALCFFDDSLENIEGRARGG